MRAFLFGAVRFFGGLFVSFFVIATAFIYFKQEYLIFPGITFPKSNGSYRLLPGVRAVKFETVDGERLQGFTSIQEGTRPQYVGIILHGNGELAESQNFIPFFRNVGIPALAFDYRGYGDSTGWPSEEGIYRDAEAAAAEAQRLTGLPYDRFVVLGNSIGSGPAAYLAQKIKARALVIVAGYADFRDLVASRPFYGLFTWALRYHFPTAEYLKKLQSTCVVLTHGERDEIIPFSHLAQMQSAVPPAAKVTVLPNQVANHNNIFYQVEPQLVAATQGCIALPS